MTDPKNPADALEGIEMLSQPLTTEEGFINPACLAEMEVAFSNMPETHERLAGDPEWSTPWVVSLAEIVAGLAASAVHGMSGHVPPHLAEVLGYARASLLRGAFADPIISTDDEIILAEMSLCDINRELWAILADLQMFDDWNREDVVGPRWLDLSACLHNVCIGIRNQRRHDLAFEREFESKYGTDQCDDS